MNPTIAIYVPYFAIVAVVCLALLARVSGSSELRTPALPPISNGTRSDQRVDRKKIHVDNLHEERTPILGPSTVSSLEEIAEKVSTMVKRSETQPAASQINKRRREENDVESDSNKDANQLQSWWMNLDPDTSQYMIKEANKRADAVSANQVDALILKRWEQEKKTLKEFFESLSHDELLEILKNPMPQTWLSYADKTKEEPYELLYKTLKKRFDEGSLTKKLIFAQEDSSTPTESLARRYKNIQCQQWYGDGQSLDDVFARLKLDKYINSVSLLKAPALKMWLLYAVDFKEENPYVFLMSRMKTVADDKEVAKLLVVAEREGGYKDYLGLEKEGIAGIGSPSWDAWMSYVKYLEGAESKSDDSSITRIGTIKALVFEISHDQEDMHPSNKKRKTVDVELDDHQIAKLLESLQLLDEDTILFMIDGVPIEMEHYLEAFLIEKWMRDKKSLRDIFKMPSDENFFEILKNPIPTVWLLYADKVFQEPYGLLVDEVTKRYKDKLKDKLTLAQKDSGTPDDSLAKSLDALV
ncbi:hypothetical protein PsorP6_017132 [Peronosclerospora sorghi]|uniref:Uncharacterized protein n=1 Tax=Peronosclerospora sorghi TaxID=230839 RepID=A0ACC0WEB7_9STRA|nr:hypothetical protein PsorP6_017132 [Peronosclerospora sorghi]